MTLFLWLTCTTQVYKRLGKDTVRLKSFTDQVKQVEQKCVGAPHQIQNSHKMPNCLQVILCEISSKVYILLVVRAEPPPSRLAYSHGKLLPVRTACVMAP